jgi:hypothetical protein
MMESDPPKQSEFINLLYGIGYIFGALALAFPPLGILVLIIVWRSHKEYRSTRLPPRGS